MKMDAKIVIIFALVLAMIPIVACSQSSPTSTDQTAAPSSPVATIPVVREITLDDAPTILNLSPLLPPSFDHIDAAREGLSNKDMGLGANASEVEVFLSEEPYQLIYCFLTITESRVQQAASDAVLKDEKQIKSIITENLKAGAAKEGFELQVPQIQVTYPDVGDLAVLGEGQMTSYGVNMRFDMLWFRKNKVYVFLYSLYLSSERQTSTPIAKETSYRIGIFSQ